MKYFLPLGLLCAILLGSCKNQSVTDSENNNQDSTDQQNVSTGVTEDTVDGIVVTNYHGTKVPDPYRWLEDDRSERTEKWVKQQNAKTETYLENIPFRKAIEERLTNIWNYPKQSAPSEHGDYYFYFKNDGLQAQSVMYRSKTSKGNGEVFLDPNTFSEDGTVSLAGMAFSDDDRYLAFAKAGAGSDWNDWYVMEVATGKMLDDHIGWSKFGGASWYKDGFFYTRFPQPEEGAEYSAQNTNSAIYYHKLGTKQENDLLVWEDPENPTYYNFGNTTEDDQYFVLSQSPGTHGQNIKVLKLEDGWQQNPSFITVVEGFDHDYSVINTVGKKLLVHTNHNAPNYRVVLMDPAKPAAENWKEIVAEGKSVLQGASTAGGKLFLTYLKDASSKVFVHNMEGKRLGEVPLPTLGTASGFGGEKDDTELYFTFTSYNYPSTIYHYDIASNKATLYRKSEVKFDPTAYVTNEVFYNSKDGEKVHMFVTHKKDLELNGQNPTLLYGYGGFNVSLTPSFNPANIVLLENGGVMAVANLRGGGEYGEAWHKAGMLEKKQNVFDDFISAAEKLIADGYTNKEKLAIKGGSNGGLLVGACMTQRPALFAVAFPQVGVLDMLRFHKFTVGKGWVVEYGSSDVPEQFKYLYAYSPLHNLEKGTAYPATMVMTADHDDRVVPAHSFKFAQTLQDAHAGDAPVLIRVETRAGHGAGKSTQQTIEEYADQWAFMFANTGVKYAAKQANP